MAGNGGGLRGLAQGRSDILKIDPRQLQINPGWNGRDFNDPDNQEHVEGLARSIAKIGVKEPLTVVWEDDRAWVTNGECRLRAVRLLIERGVDIKAVPVQTEDRFGNDADRLFSQVVRNSGKAFTQMEQAKVFKRLLDFGWDQTEIVEKSGMSKSRVNQILSLLMLPESVKQMITAGEVSAAMAQRTVAAAPSQQAAVATLKSAVVTAKAKGKTRAAPKHLDSGSDNEIEIIDDMPLMDDDGSDDSDTRKSTKSIVRDAFEYSRVDDEMADDTGNVVITMPLAHWEKIRTALKL